MSTKKKIIIGCQIFAEELPAVLPDEYSDIEVTWLDAGLHTNINKLETSLKQALADAEKEGADVRLLYGKSCHPDMCKIFNCNGNNILQAKNCIDAFYFGNVEDIEKDRTIALTPGWIRFFPRLIAVAGWDDVDIRQTFGHYDRILILDPGLNPLTDEEILEFFERVQVPIEIEPLNLDHFRTRVLEILE